MGTRASFYPRVTPDAVAVRLPPRYRPLVNASALGTEPVDLLVFEAGSRHVVTLKDLERALSGATRDANSLLAVGYDFTEEVRFELGAVGGIIFAEHNVWGWTEESWRAIRSR
jgi:hypothetical protein